jgi:hypothetical protein
MWVNDRNYSKIQERESIEYGTYYKAETQQKKSLLKYNYGKISHLFLHFDFL